MKGKKMGEWAGGQDCNLIFIHFPESISLVLVAFIPGS